MKPTQNNRWNGKIHDTRSDRIYTANISLKNPNALKVLYGAKFAMAILMPMLTFGAIAGASWESSSKFMATLAAIAIGFFAPNVTLFIQEEGASTVAAAVALWAALFAVSFWLWPDLREGTLRATAGPPLNAVDLV